MKGGRKNLRCACEEGTTVMLAEGESIMQVVTLRGSNLIEVTDGEGVKSLALFPAKFQTSFWIKNGNFVVVDASGRDEALESGSRKPAIFKSTPNGPAIFKWLQGMTKLVVVTCALRYKPTSGRNVVETVAQLMDPKVMEEGAVAEAEEAVDHLHKGTSSRVYVQS
ncbi:uncharacterized protein [Triticum aestivum]|uniref:uncharacterized protein n=1 Tax=Triticum aestivum TaxID=4565 RepID=UPI001D0145E3|nr:uncharacterized protein LOC123090342 [Triticum aestivum]